MPVRRRGTQFRRKLHRRVPLSVSGDADAFERLVERALDELPVDIRRLLENVAIVIEEEPNPAQRRTSGLGPGDSLYGLYEGTPAVEYGADLVSFPNKISLFRRPLEEDFGDSAELAEEVRRTVIHELAHHAGIDDHRLHQLGLD